MRGEEIWWWCNKTAVYVNPLDYFLLKDLTDEGEWRKLWKLSSEAAAARNSSKQANPKREIGFGENVEFEMNNENGNQLLRLANTQRHWDFENPPPNFVTEQAIQNELERIRILDEEGKI